MAMCQLTSIADLMISGLLVVVNTIIAINRISYPEPGVYE